LYAEKIAGGFLVTLDISAMMNNCPSAQLALQTFGSSGKPIHSEAIDLSGSPQTGQIPVQFNDSGLQALLLTIELPDGESCSAALDWAIQKSSP
jgi:hypothetical protein